MPGLGQAVLVVVVGSLVVGAWWWYGVLYPIPRWVGVWMVSSCCCLGGYNDNDGVGSNNTHAAYTMKK